MAVGSPQRHPDPTAPVLPSMDPVVPFCPIGSPLPTQYGPQSPPSPIRPPGSRSALCGLQGLFLPHMELGVPPSPYGPHVPHAAPYGPPGPIHPHTASRVQSFAILAPYVSHSPVWTPGSHSAPYGPQGPTQSYMAPKVPLRHGQPSGSHYLPYGPHVPHPALYGPHDPIQPIWLPGSQSAPYGPQGPIHPHMASRVQSFAILTIYVPPIPIWPAVSHPALYGPQDPIQPHMAPGVPFSPIGSQGSH